MENLSFNNVKTTLLLASLTGLLLMCGKTVGGGSGLMAAFLLAIAMNFGVYWFSDKIILALYKAQRIDSHDEPTLYSAVAYLAEKAGIPTPAVYLITSPMPNAFATGRHPAHAAVVVTTGLLKILNKDELAGVVAHELAHVVHRDTLISTIAASVGGAISLLANLAQWILVFGSGRREDGKRGSGLATLVMSLLAPMVAMLIQMAISRSREYAADERAAALCGDPLWLANALRKLYHASERHTFETAEQHPGTAHLFIINPLHNRQWQQLFSTHPPIGERIRRLESMS